MRTRTLAIDTTTEFGSLALLDGPEVVEQALLHSANGFGQILFPRIERLFDQRGWALSTVDCFASASGPGSFTGVRVGLAAAKGLAEALGKPVVAVSNLQALAWFGSAPLRATVLDARRGEIYGAVYSASLELVRDETVARFPEWSATLPDGELEFVSTDFSPFRAALSGSRFEGAMVLEVPRALAVAIGRIAADRFERGLGLDAAEADANYVRRSDAELLWKDR